MAERKDERFLTVEELHQFLRLYEGKGLSENDVSVIATQIATNLNEKMADALMSPSKCEIRREKIDKKINTVLIISVIALAIANQSLGMKIYDIIISRLGG